MQGIMLFTTASKFVPLAAAIITLLTGVAATLEVRQAPGCSPIIVCTPSSTGNTCGTACTCLAVQNVQHLPGVRIVIPPRLFELTFESSSGMLSNGVRV